MQTTRFLVVIGAVAAVWASPFLGFAASEAETQDKLREALHKKMEALDAEAPAAPAPTAKSTAPTEVVPVPAEAPVAKGDSVFSEVPTGSDNTAAEKQRAAMRQTIAADSMAPAGAPTPAPGATAMVASQPAIPSAFSSGQQERLAALLQQYKADQITPQDYHKQRAAIIAAP
jgi:hypothetical protein